MPPHPDPIAVGDVIAGKYAVERLLGRGGMGIVVGARPGRPELTREIDGQSCAVVRQLE